MKVPKKAHFRVENLVVTVVGRPFDWPPTPDPCPSVTCCGPPSVTCLYSLLMPRASTLSSVELRALVKDLRTKLQAEQSGIDVVLVAKSPEQIAEWHATLRQDLGDPVPKIDARR